MGLCASVEEKHEREEALTGASVNPAAAKAPAGLYTTFGGKVDAKCLPEGKDFDAIAPPRRQRPRPRTMAARPSSGTQLRPFALRRAKSYTADPRKFRQFARQHKLGVDLSCMGAAPGNPRTLHTPPQKKKAAAEAAAAAAASA
eukprot:Rhum_TRINITY_DN14440_c44_g1::Rhum_TRINITY_DN14440_c44_g1_i1::g.90756::m.90756